MAGMRIVETHKFFLEVDWIDGLARMRPAGTIDEDVNFGAALEWIAQNCPDVARVEFDMGGVRSINSCGVREWLLFVERLGNRVVSVFENVSEVFVEQANMISNMFGRRTNEVRTFQAPYHCEACNRE